MLSTFESKRFCQLSIELTAGVLTIALNRPDKKNAIGVEMTLEIECLLNLIQHDERIKVLLLKGLGGNFSTGMDMKDFFDHSDRTPVELARARQATNNWRSRQLRLLRQPMICAIEGYCLGGAFPMLECATWVIASDNAIFGLPEINFGFVPGGPIAKSVGIAMTRRGSSYASLTGRRFNSEQAQKWGLVSQVCKPNECIAIATKAAHEMVAEIEKISNLEQQRFNQ